MKERLGQEPAFGCIEEIHDQYGKYWQTTPSMSKRFYAACAAMQGLIAHYGVAYEESHIDKSFYYADELLKQENE